MLLCKWVMHSFGRGTYISAVTSSGQAASKPASSANSYTEYSVATCTSLAKSHDWEGEKLRSVPSACRFFAFLCSLSAREERKERALQWLVNFLRSYIH